MLMRSKRQRALSLLLAASGVLLASAMLIWPKETYQGASYGLDLWATVLVPALLPFFIITEILLNLGIVKALGVLLEPLMRPVFNLPGTASFVVAMGFTSGFPMGGIITKRLCSENLCTLSEGERLIAFTNNSSPLFIMAAVGIGMFNDPALGLLLAVAHYSSNLLLGVILGLFSRRTTSAPHPAGNILATSLRTLIQAQYDRKPIGKLLGDSIRTSINNITQIGGFIVFFGVLLQLLKVSGLLSYLSSLFSCLLKAAGVSYPLDNAFAIGLWEMTLGLRELSVLGAPFPVEAVAGSILLGWSGLSIQAQVISFIAGSGLRPHLYYLARLLQGVLSGAIAFLLSFQYAWFEGYTSLPALTDSKFPTLHFNLIYNFTFMCKGMAVLLLVFLFISFLICTLNKVKKTCWNIR